MPTNKTLMAWIAVSVLLHALLLRGVDHGIDWRPTDQADQTPRRIEAQLQRPIATPPKPPEPIAKPAAPPPPPPPRRARAPKPAPATQTQPIVPANTAIAAPLPEHHANAIAAPALAADAAAPLDFFGDALNAAPTEPLGTTELTPANSDQLEASKPGSVTLQPELLITDLPPSGTLRWDATGNQGAHVYYGSGSLNWHAEQGRYRINQQLDLSILIARLQVQRSTSEGRLTSHGLEPDRYTEQVRSRAIVAANFNREPDKQSITFSASTQQIPLASGAQDRVSVLLQLASLLRSQPNRLRPGDRLAVLLAGTREASSWEWLTVGDEIIDTPMGPTRTIKLLRQPQAESRESTVEVWFAPAIDWLPARIRYTQPRGDVVDLVVNSWTPDSAPAIP